MVSEPCGKGDNQAQTPRMKQGSYPDACLKWHNRRRSAGEGRNIPSPVN